MTGPVVHVLDASRAVGVASTLVSDTQTRRLRRRRPRTNMKRSASRARARAQSALLPLEEARANALRGRHGAEAAARRSSPACMCFDDWDLADLRDYIDWTPFFRAWELAGNYPAILDDEVVGESARSPVRRCAGDARQDHRREMADRARASPGCGRAGARATT